MKYLYLRGSIESEANEYVQQMKIKTENFFQLLLRFLACSKY